MRRTTVTRGQFTHISKYNKGIANWIIGLLMKLQDKLLLNCVDYGTSDNLEI